MKAIRGRIGQYKLLEQCDNLRIYLMPTTKFTEASLLAMLAHEEQLILKPIVGMDFITIFKKEQLFYVKTQQQTFVETSKEMALRALKQVVGDRNYVIQPKRKETKFFKKMFSRFITVQKNGSAWQVTTSTKQSNNTVETIAYFHNERVLRKMATQAAMCLGTHYQKCESIVVEVAFNLSRERFISDTFLHFSVSKWNQYQAIARFMPKTDLLTEVTFQKFLTKFPIVFLKPCNKQQGKGIIKITKRNGTSYEVQLGRQKWFKQNSQEVYELIQELDLIKEAYVIQQGILLATIDNRFTDLRVVAQKINDQWCITGKAVKVAGDHFFITNAMQEVLTLEQALKRSTISPNSHEQLEARVDTICLAAAKKLDQAGGKTVIGFDVGITNSGGIAIIEGNYVPDHSLFKRLEDDSIYNRIMKSRQVVSLKGKK